MEWLCCGLMHNLHATLSSFVKQQTKILICDAIHISFQFIIVHFFGIEDLFSVRVVLFVHHILPHQITLRIWLGRVGDEIAHRCNIVFISIEHHLSDSQKQRKIEQKNRGAHREEATKSITIYVYIVC